MNHDLTILHGLEGNEPTHLTGLQHALEPRLPLLEAMWWALFFATLAVVLYRALRSR